MRRLLLAGFAEQRVVKPPARQVYGLLRKRNCLRNILCKLVRLGRRFRRLGRINFDDDQSDVVLRGTWCTEFDDFS